MKKNIFKKIVASLATVAMAAGMFAAMPAEEAKAAEKTKEVIFTVTDKSMVDEVLVVVSSDVATCAAEDKQIPGWGEGEMGYITTSLGEGKYKITLSVTGDVVDGKYCTLKFVGLKNNKVVKGQNIHTQNYADLYNAGDTVYIYLDMSVGDWSDNYGKCDAVIDITTKDPTKVDATDVITKIDAIGTVELTGESEGKINAAEKAYNTFIEKGGDAADVTNYDKLTAARAKYNELQKADDAKYAGELVIYVKSPGWDLVKLYAWNRGNTTVFGEYPGTAMDKLAKNTGWYAAKFNIDKATNVLFGNGTEQTADWNGLKAGTYWVTLTEKGGDGKYVIAEANISTKAPSGWKDEAAKELETQAPPTTTPAPTTTAKPAVDKGSVASKDDVAKIDAEAVVEGAPADAKLDATEIAADSDAFKVVKEAAKTAFKNKTYVALDLKLVKGTETVQANGDVKVTIPVPTALAKSTKVAVYRVGDDNKLVSCGTADVTGGKITFTTNHFSTYVFADASVSATKPGDAAPIVLMLAVAAVAAGMVVASKKKTICE